MTELFTSNLNIISQRWPTLASGLKFDSINDFDACLITGNNQTISVNGIQLSSRHDRMAEAQIFIQQLPPNCSLVTVYGVGMGDVATLLTDDPNYKRITICLLNLSLFALLIAYTDQSEWLTDPRVNLIHKLEQHSIASEHIAITPDLLLADDNNAALRDLLVLENNRAFVNKQHQNDEPLFRERIAANLPVLKRDPDAATLAQIHSQPQAYVIGAGPTLEDHYSFLAQERQKALGKRPLFIAVDTALKPLLSQGINPDIVISIEKDITIAHFPEALPDSIALVYLPSIPTEVIEFWPGPKYNAYAKLAKYDEVNKQLPKLRLFTNGSVIHPAIDLAVFLNTEEITLFGCDFSYPNNKTHAYWADGSLGPKAKQAKHWVLNGKGERIATDLNFRAYLRNLEHYISSKPNINFYQSSLEGAKIKGTHYRECK